MIGITQDFQKIGLINLEALIPELIFFNLNFGGFYRLFYVIFGVKKTRKNIKKTHKNIKNYQTK